MPEFLQSKKKLPAESIHHSLQTLTRGFDGRIGIGIQDSGGVISINGDQRFSLQSVMKLFVAATAMDTIDQGRWKLTDPVLVQKQDLSLNVQPLADLVGKTGYLTTIGDLIFRAVVESDSAANDILFAKVGKDTAINGFLKRNGISGVRIDRDERHLQTEIVGLRWRLEYVDADMLARAKLNVPPQEKEAAFKSYLKDVRDTATPTGMTAFLYKLATGKILSEASTRHLLGVMRQTTTFPDRLKAGIPGNWTIAHKTGTSNTWNGINGTTNDVGILTAPDKHIIAVSVFIAESRRSPEQRAALMAEVSHIITTAYFTYKKLS